MTFIRRLKGAVCRSMPVSASAPTDSVTRTLQRSRGQDPCCGCRMPMRQMTSRPQVGPGVHFCWTRAKFLETSSSLRPSNFREISGKSVTTGDRQGTAPPSIITMSRACVGGEADRGTTRLSSCHAVPRSWSRATKMSGVVPPTESEAAGGGQLG